MFTNLDYFSLGVGAVVGVIIALLIVIIYAKKAASGGKIDVGDVIDGAQDLLDDAEKVNNISKAFLPTSITSITSKIIETAELAVNASDQLYNSGQLPVDERFTKAVNSVKNALGIEGVTVTAEMLEFINDTIEGQIGKKKATIGTAVTPTATDELTVEEATTQTVDMDIIIQALAAAGITVTSNTESVGSEPAA
ncbi:MAG: hypothetical protein NC238_03085 [Dehalobacter sp.]|nr:hypothetical protein [Dehalobacter sp.]